MFVNLDFGRNFSKIYVLVENFKNLDFFKIINIAIKVKFLEIIELRQNFRKIFPKLSISVKIFEYLDFC